jgi:hypothetical protein
MKSPECNTWITEVTQAASGLRKRSGPIRVDSSIRYARAIVSGKKKGAPVVPLQLLTNYRASLACDEVQISLLEGA